MKVIGFSSGTIGRLGNVDRMVRGIMEKSGHEYEFVKLTDLVFSGCKGCSWLCATPQTCMLKDDLLPYYQKIKQADGVVIGSPVHGGGINGDMAAFLDRFYGFNHVTRSIKNKPFIGVLGGYRTTVAAAEQLRRKLARFQLLDVVEYQSSTPPCVRCGRHRECSIGGLYRMLGDAAHCLEITPEVFHKWEDNPEATTAIEMAGAKLKDI